MTSFNRIGLFVVILFSCSFCLNGKSLKSVGKTERANGDTSSESRRVREAYESDNYGNDDGYVMEDMTLVQNDQPFSRPSHIYGQPPNEAAPQEPKKRMGSLPGNLQFTKEVLIKQGRLKGYVRTMHPQTGLKNVRQYLGIPYAAAPTLNGRFMPPGLFLCLRFIYVQTKFVLFLLTHTHITH